MRPGLHAYGESCVPEACGTGTWGALERDDDNVHVDASAAAGGDGSAGAPLDRIQAALDLAASRGGGLVAVAAGTYQEALSFGAEHAGIHLAGRCHELVTLDASTGGGQTPGIAIDSRHGEVTVSGLTVAGSPYVGIYQSSGSALLEDMLVEGNAFVGIGIRRESMSAPCTASIERCEVTGDSAVGIGIAQSGAEATVLDSVVSSCGFGVEVSYGASFSAEGTELVGNTELGVLSVGQGSHASLVETSIRDTRFSGTNDSGIGIQVWDSATATLEHCDIVGNTGLGVMAADPGTVLTMLNTKVEGTLLTSNGADGFGIDVQEGATMRAEDCEIVGNASCGVRAKNTGSEVILLRTVVWDTLQDAAAQYGHGIEVSDGATLTAIDCEIANNRVLGIAAADSGTVVELRETRIRDHRPGGLGTGGHGVNVFEGATLTASSCVLLRNATVGLAAYDRGTAVSLQDTEIWETAADAAGEHGYAVEVYGGATLVAESCDMADNTTNGLRIHGWSTEVTLVDTVVSGTKPTTDDELGYGLWVWDGAMLSTQGCDFVDNRGLGLAAFGAGTQVRIDDTIVRDTQADGDGVLGYGMWIYEGAKLTAENSEIADNTGLGIVVVGADTLVTLHDTTVHDTRPDPRGDGGWGIDVMSGAKLEVDGCVVSGNTGVGIVADEAGTSIDIRDSSIIGTKAGFGGQSATALGLMVEQEAAAEASGLLAQGNEGPGIYVAGPDTRLSCTDCSLLDNRFAGAAAVYEARLEVLRSTISGTTEGANIGGGVGVYGAPVWGFEAPSILISDSTITDNLVGGAWLAGEGDYQLSSNTISGSRGVPHGNGRRCGDGVYARDTSTAGLSLDDNWMYGNAGAGLFLDDGSATLGGNTWDENDIDLLVQGQACLSSDDDYSAVPTTDICPLWDRPSCELLFGLALDVADVEPARPPPPPAPLLSVSAPTLTGTSHGRCVPVLLPRFRPSPPELGAPPTAPSSR